MAHPICYSQTELVNHPYDKTAILALTMENEESLFAGLKVCVKNPALSTLFKQLSF
jgi:hypothetical protein